MISQVVRWHGDRSRAVLMAGDELRLERDRTRVQPWTRTSDVAPSRRAVVEEPAPDRFADVHEVWRAPAFLLPDAFSPVEVPPPRPIELLDSKTRAMVGVLVRGGLDEADAIELLTRGATAERATDMLSVRMLQPRLENYGAAVLAIRLLSEARALGGLTAARVRDISNAHRSMVVVRPDGVLAEVVSGRAIERLSAPSMRDGRVVAGGLVVGATYHVAGGVLRAVDASFAPGAIAGELGLDRLAIGAVLDGVESAVGDVVHGLAKTIDGLIFRPEAQIAEMVDGFGRLPRTVATFIRRSPELYEAFRNLPERDRIEAVAKLVTSLFIMAAGAASGAGAASAAVGAFGGLRGLALVDGGLVVGGDFALGAVAVGSAGLFFGASWSAAQGALEGGAEHARIGERVNGLDAKGQWRAEQRVRRAIGDVRDGAKYQLHDLEPALELAEKLGPNELAIVRNQVADRLAADASKLELRDLAACARVMKRLGPELERGVREALHGRIRSEIETIKGLTDSRRDLAIRRLRAALDESGIDLRAALGAGRPAPPVSSLSPGAQRAIQAIDRGEENVSVSSKAEAEEVLSQYTQLIDTGNWGMDMIKALLPEKKRNTFHWDDVFTEDGYLLHHEPPNPHAETPHLQLHFIQQTIRIFFPGGPT